MTIVMLVLVSGTLFLQRSPALNSSFASLHILCIRSSSIMGSAVLERHGAIGFLAGRSDEGKKHGLQGLFGRASISKKSAMQSGNTKVLLVFV